MTVEFKEEDIVALITRHARKAARSMKASGLTEQDFFQEGYVAYIKSKDRYNPDNESGASFKTFIEHRIRGAIIDATRGFYWLGYNQAKLRGSLLRANPDAQTPFPSLEYEKVGQEMHNHLSNYKDFESLEFQDFLDFICKGLTEKEKHIFISYFVYEKSCKAISLEYGVHERTILDRIKKIILPYVSCRFESYLKRSL